MVLQVLLYLVQVAVAVWVPQELMLLEVVPVVPVVLAWP
jgi:hypothetical protein